MSFLTRFEYIYCSIISAASKTIVSVFVILSFASTVTYAQKPAQTSPTKPQQGAVSPPQQAPLQSQIVNMLPKPGQPWLKFCGKEDGGAYTCLISREFIMDNDLPGITLTIYDIGKPQNTKHIRILVPLGFKLKPGARFAVDGQKHFAGYYDVCVPTGCYINFENISDLITQMFKGKGAVLAVRDAGGEDIYVAFPLEGLEAGFKGKAIDKQAIEAEQKKLKDDLIEESKTLRGNLMGTDNTDSVSPKKP